MYLDGVHDAQTLSGDMYAGHSDGYYAEGKEQSQIQDFPNSKSRRDSVGGGGSARNFPLMGPFYIFFLSQRGGGPGPLGPPAESATEELTQSFASTSLLSLCAALGAYPLKLSIAIYVSVMKSLWL